MIESILSSSLLIVAVTALRYALRGRISLRLQYGLWALVALRLLLPFPLFDSSLSVTAALGAPAIESAVEDHHLPIRPASESDFNVGLDQPAGEERTGNEERSISLDSLLKGVWLAGAAVMAVWLLSSNLRLLRRLKQGRRPVAAPLSRLPVYCVEGLPTPCLFGLLRPAVYLTPESLEEGRMSHILTHELTHYTHGDSLWNLIRALCLTVYWFNPLVWAAASLSRRDCELACDEGVIARLGEENRFAYGRTLVGMAAVGGGMGDMLRCSTAMVSGKAGLKERIALIAKRPRMLVFTLVSVLGLCALLAACTFSGAPREAPAPSPSLPLASPLEDEAQPQGDEAAGTDSVGLLKFGPGGEVLAVRSLLSAPETARIEDVVFNYLVKSAAWPGPELESLEEYYLIRYTYANGETSDYYAYCMEGRAYMQGGENGWCSVINGELYETLGLILDGSFAALDSAITKAVLEHNAGSVQGGEFRTESHIYLGGLEEDNRTTTAYLMVYYGEYSFENEEPRLVGGSHLPVALTFARDGQGNYTLNAYWEPGDGSEYFPSIAGKFPEELAHPNTQQYVDTQRAICDGRAQAYLESRD